MSSPDRKRTSEESTVAAVIITPHKKKRRLELEEKDNGNRITAESIMGFPKYPNLTNREIMINHHDFVDWAKRKKKEGTAYGRLLDFINWVEESEEVSKLEEEREIIREGQEVFAFGRQKGKTFKQIAEDEPNYHEKYMYMLAKNREEPNPVLSRYIAWFDKKKRHLSAQVQSSSEARIISQADDSGDEERFTFGKHRGQSFSWVAINDPSYHLRCKAKGFCPDEDCMHNYVEYFEHHGDRYAAEKGERDAILDRCYELGIGCH